MKVTTFIRAYKIILSDIEKKIRDWERVFITDVSFDSNKLQIVLYLSNNFFCNLFTLS